MGENRHSGLVSRLLDYLCSDPQEERLKQQRIQRQIVASNARKVIFEPILNFSA